MVTVGTATVDVLDDPAEILTDRADLEDPECQGYLVAPEDPVAPREADPLAAAEAAEVVEAVLDHPHLLSLI